MSIKIPSCTLCERKKGGARLFWAFGKGFYNRASIGLVSLFFGLFIHILLNFGLAAQTGFDAKVIKRAEQLPVAVQRMHRALLRAARSGDISNMRDVLQMSELKPLIDGRFLHDPVKRWKRGSIDHTGREVLALFTQLLELPAVKKTSKNGVVYVWPYFAGVPLDRLSASEIVRLYRLADAATIASNLKNNHYSLGVVSIGADGTWHSFDHPRGHWMGQLSP